MAPATGTATLSSRQQRLLPRPQPRPPRPSPTPAPPPPAAEHCIIYARNNSRRTFNANICIQFCTTQTVILSTLREQHQWERLDEAQHPHLITRWTGTNSAQTTTTTMSHWQDLFIALAFRQSLKASATDYYIPHRSGWWWCIQWWWW